MDKSRKKIAQDYSRNAIADSKSSKKSIKKDGKYEAKMAVKEAAGEGAKMYGKSKGPKMESNAQEKKNLMNDNPVASRASSPMKMKGSYLSKHMKSGM